MTYHNAVKYILKAPTEQIDSAPGARLRQIWDYFEQPQRNLKYLRLAGNNGKTVCASMLISAFKNSDYLVGCLTTPIRPEIRENILINGAPPSFDEMAAYVEKIYKAVIGINKEIARKNEKNRVDALEQSEAPQMIPELILTKYEILLTTALLAFREKKCKFCIIESDHAQADPSRFLPAPLVAAICGTIPSSDHKEIQRIRSYICPGIQEIVSAPQDRDAYQIISETCASINCRLTIPSKSELALGKLTLGGSDFSYKGKAYRISLCGRFQITNATVVLEILNMLSRRGFSLSDEQIREGLSQTKIPSKFEILSVSPTIIADSTHSDIAIETVCDSMAEFQPMMGNGIRLCLPQGDLVERYIEVLRAKDYNIEKIITLSTSQNDQEQEEIPFPDLPIVHCKKLRDAVFHALKGLRQDEILLISGPYWFTSTIRYELLKSLGF